MCFPRLMANIRRIPVLWGGIPGMPGYSLFYTEAASDATADVVAFFNAIKALFPASLQWSIPPAGDTLDDATGALTGTWVGAGAGIVTGTGPGAYAAGTGAWARWNTNAIIGRRRLRGRTFLCPLVSSSGYDTSGTLLTSAVTTLQAACAALAATGKLVVWHRPSDTGGLGSSSLIVSSAVPDQVTSLRSRRY